MGAIVGGARSAIAGGDFGAGAASGAISSTFQSSNSFSSINTSPVMCFVAGCGGGSPGGLSILNSFASTGSDGPNESGEWDLGTIVISVPAPTGAGGGSVMSAESITRVFGRVARAAGRAVEGLVKFGIDNFHSVLDVAGLIPGIGNAFDLFNAGAYAIEGDKVNAGLSATGAIPVLGLGATAGKIGGKTGTEVVQRWMSRAELNATRRTGFMRGGKAGTHYVTDAANSNAKRARMRSALKTTPEVRVELEVPQGVFSSPTRVHPDYGMPGGGMERRATGLIPAKIKRVFE